MGGKPTHDNSWEELLFSFIRTTTYSSSALFSFILTVTYLIFLVVALFWGGANDDLHEHGEENSLLLQHKRDILFSRCLIYSHVDSHRYFPMLSQWSQLLNYSAASHCVFSLNHSHDGVARVAMKHRWSCPLSWEVESACVDHSHEDFPRSACGKPRSSVTWLTRWLEGNMRMK